MPGRQDRQAGSVNYAQTANTADLGIGVEHGHGIVSGTHLAGARGVEDGRETLLDVAPDLIVRSYIFAGIVLVADQQRAHGWSLPHLTRALECRDGYFFVGRMAEPVGVDEGRVGHVVRLNRHIASRQRGY